MGNKVEKMGIESDISSIVNKYLDKDKAKVTNFSAGTSSVNFYKESEEANRDYAIIKLKNGQTIKVQEESLLYEKAKQFAHENFLMIDAYKFLNPSEVAEFIDIDNTVDYSTKDLPNEEIHAHQEVDPDWKKVFYGDENE